MPRRTIAGAESPAIFSPSSTMRPPSGRSAPVTRLKKLVLPAPLGPITAVNDPGAKCRLTSLMAVTPPKDFCRCSIFSMSALARRRSLLARVRAGQILVPGLHHEAQQSLTQSQRKHENHNAKHQAVVLGHLGDEIVQRQQ